MKIKISRYVFIYAVFQLSVIFSLYHGFNFDRDVFIYFAVITFLWHVLVYYFLVAHLDEFYNVKTKEPLEEFNLANRISLFRTSSVSTIGFLVIHYEVNSIKIITLVYLGMVFFTDFLDGRIARSKNQETQIGKSLDSMSDYALLTLISVLYWQYNILHTWFFVIILIRLFIQGLGMSIFISLDYPMPTESTIGGKITIGGTMYLYTAKMFGLLFQSNIIIQKILSVAEIIFAVIVFILIFEKLWLFYKHAQRYLNEKKNRTNIKEKE